LYISTKEREKTAEAPRCDPCKDSMTALKTRGANPRDWIRGSGLPLRLLLLLERVNMPLWTGGPLTDAGGVDFR
jgi:hypothetical protein